MKILLSMLAGVLLASTSFAEVPEGVAYTTEVIVNSAQRTSSGRQNDEGRLWRTFRLTFAD